MIGLGLMLNKTPKVKDWTIPWILMVVAIGLIIVYSRCALEEGFTPQMMTIAVVQGSD